MDRKKRWGKGYWGREKQLRVVRKMHCHCDNPESSRVGGNPGRAFVSTKAVTNTRVIPGGLGLRPAVYKNAAFRKADWAFLSVEVASPGSI